MNVRRTLLGLACACALLAGGVSPAAGAPTELFFSEYIEGTSNNKALEIFNGTGAPIDLGAGAYSIQMFFNGSTTAGLTINLVGTVAPGDVWVVAQSAASPVILAQADQTNGAGWFNGDDAVTLRKGTTVIDSIGQVGFDPGTEWGTGLTSTADNTLRRKAAIEAGDPLETDVFDPAVQWDGFATDTFDGLGAHGAPPGDAAPTVASTVPANNASDVAASANVSITFSEPVDVAGAWYTISCTDSGVHTATVSGGPTTHTLDPDTDLALDESCTVTVVATQVTDQDANDPPDAMVSNHAFSFATVAPTYRIYEIQGASHTSPLNGQNVSAVPGVITVVRSNSITIQDATGDGNDATSDAILVFGLSTTGLAPGQAVTVSGRVSEFRPGGSSSTNLTTTEIVSPTVLPAGPGAIAPTVVGAGGRMAPTAVIEDDATGDVETSGVFDPSSDGIDFWESLEAMLLQVNDPLVVGPSNSFTETWVLPDNGAGAGVLTNRRGIVISVHDFNPERLQIEDTLVPVPAANVGDGYSTLVGVLDYNFGNFELLATQSPTRIDRGLQRETTPAASASELTVATFNVENLDPSDVATIPRLASIVVDNLRSPDLIGIEEMQDNNGATNDGTTAANLSWEAFIAAIAAAGGPVYDYRQIDPENNADGGQPGGNIRVGFLFRTDRKLEFIDRPGGDATTPTGVTRWNGRAHLTLSPGRVDPGNPAWVATRKPLAGEFKYRGQTFIAIVNHFSSKGGDDPLFGRFQPPIRSSEVARHQQAASVNAFVDEILAAERRANVIVLGDINDFEFSETTAILTAGGVLTSLFTTLPQAERYSYVFEGNSQVLDQILFSENMLRGLAAYDVVHVNSEFADQASDHDPSVVRTRVLFGGGGGS